MVEPLLLYSECSEQLGVAFKTGDEAGGVPAPAAHRLDFGVKLIDQRGERKLRAVLTSFFERDRHVLAHPVDGETEIELARSHRPGAAFHLCPLRSTPPPCADRP